MSSSDIAPALRASAEAQRRVVVASGETSFDDVDVSRDVASRTPVLTARTRPHATTSGRRGTRPLQLQCPSLHHRPEVSP